jgi:dihydrofolate reductase
MLITLIAAADENNVIGGSNRLLWTLDGDFRRMQALTTGHPIIMGRKTHQSIGRVLPKRTNLVVTSDPSSVLQGAHPVSSLDDAIAYARMEEEGVPGGTAFIFGGEQIYRAALPVADRIELTRVHAKVEGGDAYFPEIPAGQWRLVASERHEADDKNEYPFTFETYDRIS